MGADNFSLLDNQDQFGNAYYPADDKATIIEKEIWDELLRSKLGSVKTVANADSPYTVLRTDSLLLIDTGAGAVTLNLPAASDLAQMTFYFKKTSTDFNLVTINADGTDTIDGTASRTILSPNGGFTVAADGTSLWSIIA